MSISTFLNTLILLGALQGFIVAGLLRSSARQKPEERVSRQLLAVLVCLIALACLDVYLEQSDWWSSGIGGLISALLPLIVAMPFGPLAYFYIRSLEEPDFRLTRADRRHFYPVVIDLLPHAAVLIVVVLALLGFFRKTHGLPGFGTVLDYYNQYADIPRWISFTIYLALATGYLRRRKSDRRPSQRGTNGPMESGGGWPRTFLRVLWAFDLLWLAFNIPYELPRIGDLLIGQFGWYPLYIPMVVIIYYLGVKGYFLSYRVPVVMAAAVTIPGEKLGQVVATLKKSMEEERLWLHADLNLGRLAQHCGVAPKLLSVVLNQHMNTTFNEFVNGYRVAAVCDRLLMPESRELTIAGLAYECGFNSLPTFQRAFKAVAGMSPKEYMGSQPANCDQIRI